MRIPLANCRQPIGWLALSASLALCIGCGPAPVAVEGDVRLDGKPLDEAAILFVPLNAERQKTGTAIQGGTYHLPAADGLLPGTYRVEIMDNPPLSGGHRIGKSVRRPFPYRYSNESPLQLEIGAGSSPGEAIRADFELTTAP